MLKKLIVLLLMFTHLPTRAVSSITFFECSSDAGCSSEEKDEEYYRDITRLSGEELQARQEENAKMLMEFQQKWDPDLTITDINDLRNVLEAFIDSKRYDWEHPEEYQDRMKRAEAVCKELDDYEYRVRMKRSEALRHELEDYEAAFNAEEYHHRKARNIGYRIGSALQIIFLIMLIRYAVARRKTLLSWFRGA